MSYKNSRNRTWNSSLMPLVQTTPADLKKFSSSHSYRCLSHGIGIYPKILLFTTNLSYQRNITNTIGGSMKLNKKEVSQNLRLFGYKQFGTMKKFAEAMNRIKIENEV